MLLLFGVHFVGDFYAMFGPPLLPELRSQFGMTLGMTTTLATYYLIIQNFSQPVMGLVSERVGRKGLAVVGLLMTTVGMSALGFATSYLLAFVFLTVGGLGVGMFHPTGSALAGAVAKRKSTAMTLYMAGGNLGIMTSPILVTWLARRDLRLVSLLAAPGLVMCVWLWLRLDDEPASDRHGRIPDVAMIWRALKKLWWIHLRVVLRFIPMQAVLAFLPLYCVSRGYTKVQGGQIQSFVLLISGIGVLAGGWLTAKLPRRGVILVSEIGAGICLMLMPMANGAWFLTLLSAGLFTAYIVFPLQVLMAQEAAPEMKGTAAAVVMGLAYGNAAILLLPLNAMASHIAKQTGSERLGLSRQMQVAAVGFFLAAAIAMFVKMGRTPADERRHGTG